MSDSNSQFSYQIEIQNNIAFDFNFFKSRSKYFFLCKDCYKIPLIKFDEKSILILCQHNNKNQNLALGDEVYEIIITKKLNELDFIKEYLFGIEYSDYMICQEHHYPFLYYCETFNCLKNLCKECIQEHSKLNHKNLINFAMKNLRLEQKIQNINNVFKLNEDFEKELDISDIKDNNKLLKLLIISIIKDYSLFPNYNIIQNIESINDFADKYTKSVEKNENMKKEIRINSYIELENIIEKNKEKNDQLKYIEYIRIFQKDYQKMNLLRDNYEYLYNLKELHLKQICMQRIDTLIKCEFLNLEILDLENNFIDDDNLKFFYQFKDKFPNLKELNLKKNDLTNYEFFESIQTLKNLIKLNVSTNAFSHKNNNNKYIFKNIEEIIFSNGVFNNESINNIQYFVINNIKIIDLSSNNLKSLSFIKDVNWPEINTILINDNSLRSIKELSEFQNLELIEIKDNPIENIEEIENIFEKKIENSQIKIYLNIITNKPNIRNNNKLNINERTTETNSHENNEDW